VELADIQSREVKIVEICRVLRHAIWGSSILGSVYFISQGFVEVARDPVSLVKLAATVVISSIAGPSIFSQLVRWSRKRIADTFKDGVDAIGGARAEAGGEEGRT
jgi:hypothetical protein